MVIDVRTPILEALVNEAAEVGLPLEQYVNEVLESHAADRRLKALPRSPGVARNPGHESIDDRSFAESLEGRFVVHTQS
jgi:hypothetical protein